MKKLVIAIVTTLSAAAGLATPAAAWHDDPYDPYDPGCQQAYYPSKVDVSWGSSWWAATILQARGNQFLIHYDGYSSTWDEWVGPERIRGLAPVAQPYDVPYADSAIVSIYWGSSWYPGRVLSAANGQFLVSYDGYSSSWNEWVGRDRLRFASTPGYRAQTAQTVRPVAPVRRVRYDRYEDPAPAWRPARPVHVGHRGR